MTPVSSHPIPNDYTQLDPAWIQKNFLDLFTDTVEKYAGNIAITSKGRRLTYQELDARSNVVANTILNILGDGKSPVALLLTHDLDAIVAVLGVIKTGRPYVAMDLSFPLERMNQIMDDSQAAMILCDNEYHPAALELQNVRSSIHLININELDYSNDTAPYKVEISAKDACIIYYTSGSTGKPKGVVWGHQQLISNVVHNANAMYLSPSDVYMFVTSIAFASSRSPIFDVLASGGQISMFDIKAEGISALRDWMVTERVTLFRGGVQVFRTLFSELEEGFMFPSLRAVGLGGQSSTPGDIALCRAHTSSGCSFLHSLVNTEVGVLTAFHITSDMTVVGEFVPLGKPLPDKEIVLVDEVGNTVPDGEEGEIVVHADFFAPGYLNDDALNAQKYRHNPDGTTTYFSGDIGCWSKDGFLEHHGRKDDLVKIRGYRINLLGIESAIRKIEFVRDVAVTVRSLKGRLGTRQLVAYVITSPNEVLTVGDIRYAVSGELPEYMVPSLVVFLESLPQLPNGKVNRLALPEPPERQALDSDNLPENVTDETLIAIWKKVLNLDIVGVNDNFFELGGDSLLAMQLLLEIERKFSRKMPLSLISRASNIREQAGVLLQESTVDFASVLIPIRPEGTKEPIFCISGKGGNPIRFHQFVKYLNLDRPVYFFRSRGFSEGEQAGTSIEGIASDFLNEVKRVQSEGPYYFVGESGGGMIAYEMAQKLLGDGKKTALIVMLDTYLAYTRRSKKEKLIKQIWLLMKHIQTLTKGGMDGLRAYLNYYFELQRFKLNEYRDKKRVNNMLERSGNADVYRHVEEANMKAGRAYKPQPYPGRVLMLSAVRQITVEGDMPDRGWNNVGVGELIVHPIDCYHGNILFEPFVQQVVEKVNQYLE